MLGNFMDDIGITPDQFEKACTEGRNYQMAFDQVNYKNTFLLVIQSFILHHPVFKCYNNRKLTANFSR